MLFLEMDKILKPYRDKVDELEARAGIQSQTERAREGSFFPLGADGEKVDPDEYFADEADYARRGIRRAYFGVLDDQLRKELIEALRALEAKHSELLDSDLSEKASEVVKAKAATRRLPWGTGLVIAIVCIVLARWFSGEGAITVGAVIGLFLGLGYVWNSKGAAESALEQAEVEQKQVQRDRRIRKLSPETFKLSEELTGEENAQFGDENGRWNVKEFLEKEVA